MKVIRGYREKQYFPAAHFLLTGTSLYIITINHDLNSKM